MTWARSALAAIALAAASAASAQGRTTVGEGTILGEGENAPTDRENQESQWESPRWGSFQISVSGYHPKIDSEFGGAATPYATTLGNGRGLMFRADVAYSLLVSDYGTVDVGVGGGYWEKYGKGLLPDGSVSSDSTALKVVPTRLAVTYRYDWLALHYPIPLVPYVRLAFDRYWWWVNTGSGATANANGQQGSGATNGYSLGAGIALLLNTIDRSLAREMDRDTGINQTYFFVDFTKSYIADFGSKSSWDMSDSQVTIAGGILFVF